MNWNTLVDQLVPLVGDLDLTELVLPVLAYLGIAKPAAKKGKAKVQQRKQDKQDRELQAQSAAHDLEQQRHAQLDDLAEAVASAHELCAKIENRVDSADASIEMLWRAVDKDDDSLSARVADLDADINTAVQQLGGKLAAFDSRVNALEEAAPRPDDTMATDPWEGSPIAPGPKPARNVRNNNPGNLVDDGTNWRGLANPRNDGRFYRFSTALLGARALARSSRNAVRKRQPSYVAFFERYAPASDGNDPRRYAALVAGGMSASVDSIPQIDTDEACGRFCRLIATHEGHHRWPLEMFVEAARLARK